LERLLGLFVAPVTVPLARQRAKRRRQREQSVEVTSKDLGFRRVVVSSRRRVAAQRNRVSEWRR